MVFSPLGVLGTATQVAHGVTNLANALSAPTVGGVLGLGNTGPVVLGTFSFAGFEVPATIPFGGSQQMTVHKFPGGDRQIDVMGADARDIDWSGTFLGADAITRAQQVDALRVAGDVIPLLFGEMYFSVIIKSFMPDHGYATAKYQISCTILRDETAAYQASINDATSDVADGLNDTLTSVTSAINNVAQQAQAVIMQAQTVVSAVSSVITPITSALGIEVPIFGQIQAGLSEASSTVSGIDNLANAGATAISAVQGSIQGTGYIVYTAQGQANALLASSITGAPAGGIVPTISAAQTAAYAAGMQANLSQIGGQIGTTNAVIAQEIGTPTPAPVSSAGNAWSILAPPPPIGALVGSYNAISGTYE